MVRSFLCALFVLALCTVSVLAKEYKGQATKLDNDKKEIMVKVGDKEETIKFDDKTEFTFNGRLIKEKGLRSVAQALTMTPRNVTVETNDKNIAVKVAIEK